jgi:hypothetical protein
MRRTLLLGAITPTLGLAILGLMETLLLAQSPKLDAPTPAAAPIEANGTTFGRAAQATPFGSDGSLPASAPAQNANPIRQRFIELSRKKAYALGDEELKREVDVMEAEVRELEAWAKTQEAIRLLRDIADNHRNTKAAEAANDAIQLLENRHAAARGSESIREPGFQRRDLAPVLDPRPENELRRSPQREEKPKQPVSRLDHALPSRLSDRSKSVA